MTGEQAVAVRAPLPAVWRLLCGLESWPAWNTDVVAVDLDGPVAAGSVVAMTTAAGGWRARIYAMVDEDALFWGDVIDDGPRWLQTWALQETVSGVTVTVTTSVLGRTTPDLIACLHDRLRLATAGRLAHLRQAAESDAIRTGEA